MKRYACAVACAALWVLPVAAQDTPTAPPAPPAAAASTRSVQLSRVILNPEIARENQHVKVGTICLFSGDPLNFGAGERTLNFEHFERLFSAAMTRHHFNVVARSSNLFEGEGNSPAAEYLVGAIVRPQSVDICDSVAGQKGTITVSVEWQFYDRGRQQVVETATTQGSGHVERFQQNGLSVMTDEAFAASLDALVEQGIPQRHLGAPAH